MPTIGRRDFLRIAQGAGLGALAVMATGCDLLGSEASAAARSFDTMPGLKFPRMTVRPHGVQPPGLFFVTASGRTGTTGPMIFDQTGQPVWFNPLTGTAVTNLRVQQYQGQPVLTWWQGTTALGYGQGQYIVVDTAYEELFQVALGGGLSGDLHEFLITDHDTALVIAYTPRQVSGALLLECVIQELELPSGQVLFEWHSADHVAAEASYADAPTDGVTPFDYFHANAVEVYDQDHLLISSRNTWAVYKVNKTTGDITWRLGGKHSDFTQPEGTRFEWQHDSRWHGNGTMSLFDNGADPKIEPQSRGLILDIDESAKTSSLRQQFLHPKAPSAGSQGNLQILPDGSVVIGWGAQPYVTHHGADGSVLLETTFPTDMYTYRGFMFEWKSQPKTSPNFAVTRNLTGSVTARASWNGATEVAHWELWAGRDRDNLRKVAQQRKTAFETVLKGEASDRYLELRAVDAQGTVIGTAQNGTPAD